MNVRIGNFASVQIKEYVGHNMKVTAYLITLLVGLFFLKSIFSPVRSAFEADYTEDAVVARYRAFFDRVTGECAASPG